MERYYDFDALSNDASARVEALAEEHGLDPWHPLVICAVLEAIASPLKLHMLQGSPLMNPVGQHGSDAYMASLLARRVEVLKSPHSQTINGAMDAVVASLIAGQIPSTDYPSAIEYLVEGGVIRVDDAGSISLSL